MEKKLYRKCSIPSDTSVYNDEVLTLAAKFTIIPVAVITELLYNFCVRGEEQ